MINIWQKARLLETVFLKDGQRLKSGKIINVLYKYEYGSVYYCDWMAIDFTLEAVQFEYVGLV